MASLGRFTSRDRWAGLGSTPQTLNGYAYAQSNPTSHVDPSGHCLFISAAIGAALGDVAGTVVYFATTPSEDWSVGNVAGSAAIGAASGAIIGFTGGVAAGAVAGGALTVAEGTILVGIAGYATGLFTSGLQAASGRPVSPTTVF